MTVRTVHIAEPGHCPEYIRFLKGDNLSQALHSLNAAIKAGDRRLMFWKNPDPKPGPDGAVKSAIPLLAKDFYRARLNRPDYFSTHYSFHYDSSVNVPAIDPARPLATGVRISETNKGVGSYFYFIDADGVLLQNIWEAIGQSNYIDSPQLAEYEDRIKGSFTPAAGQAGFLLSKRFGELRTLHGSPYESPAQNITATQRSIATLKPFPWFD